MIQKEFVKKVGITSNTPASILNIIDDTSEEFVKATSIQNQIMLTTIDATQQNIKTYNDNVKSFTDLNKNILESWILHSLQNVISGIFLSFYFSDLLANHVPISGKTFFCDNELAIIPTCPVGYNFKVLSLLPTA